LWKKILLVVILIASFKCIVDYFNSPQFQTYGDQNKAVWTCYVNNVLGNLFVVWGHYEDGRKMFDPIIKRCPQCSSLVENVEFKIAETFENEGLKPEAAAAYAAFLEKYPKSSHCEEALKSLEIFKNVR